MQYQTELISWRRHKAKYKAEIKTYFGEAMAEQFAEIQTLFEKLENQIKER